MRAKKNYVIKQTKKYKNVKRKKSTKKCKKEKNDTFVKIGHLKKKYKKNGLT